MWRKERLGRSAGRYEDIIVVSGGPGDTQRHPETLRGIQRHSEAPGDTTEKEWNNLEERGIIRKRISCHQPSAGNKI